MQQQIDKSCMRTKNQTYSLFSKLGLGVSSFNFICCSYICPLVSNISSVSLYYVQFFEKGRK